MRNPRKRTSRFSKREDAAEALETPEEPFDLVALAVHGFVILPGFEAIALAWNHRNKAEIQRQLAGFVVFVGSIHDECSGAGSGPMPPSRVRPRPHRRLGRAKARRLWPLAHSRGSRRIVRITKPHQCRIQYEYAGCSRHWRPLGQRGTELLRQGTSAVLRQCHTPHHSSAGDGARFTSAEKMRHKCDGSSPLVQCTFLD